MSADTEKVLQELPREAILALAAELYDAGKQHIANGGAVTAQDVATLNETRRLLSASKPR